MQEKLTAGVANAAMTMVGVLLDALAAKGIVDKQEYADTLRRLAKEAQETATPDLMGFPRFDLDILREMADLAAKPKSDWKPVVIQGGKSDPEET